jgi:hypothetical protein
LSKKLMLLVALSLAFAAMFMFAGSASAQTSCPPGTTPSSVFNPSGNPVDRHFVCVPVGTTNVVPVDGFVNDFNGFPTQEFNIRRVSSGPANPTTTINNTGSNVNLSAPVQQVANTGNVVNEQGVVTDGTGFNTPFVDDGFVDGRFVDGRFVDGGFFDDGFFDGGFGDGFSTTGDIDFSGSSINLAPTLTSDTNQVIEQAAAV